MIRLAFALLLIFYLPGAILFRLPGRSRAYRALLPTDERLFWTVLTSVTWSVFVVLALGALREYSFEKLLLANAAASGLAVVLFRQHLVLGANWRPGWSALLPIGLVALGWSLYFPASEYVIGGKDPGTYINEGLQIAQRGSVIVRDTTVAAVPAPLRDLFFPSHARAEYYGIRFMGFFIQDPNEGTVVAQFPHLYPASIAIAYGLDGLSGARDAIGLWAILGLLAVYYAGAEMFGRPAAAAAAALLAVNVATIWFARYPNSELPMQALLFAALLATQRARHGGGRYFAITAGALLGGILFLRYEVLLAFVAVAAVAVMAPITKTKFGASFTIALALASAAGLWYLLVPMRAYSYYPLGFIQTRGGWLLGAAGLIGAVVVNRSLRIEPVAALVRRWLPWVVSLALAGLAFYGYFIREPGGRTALGDAIAFRSFAWYITPEVLAVAVLGAAILTITHFWKAPLFFTTFAVFSVFFFYKTRIVPEHFWTSRRFLGMALPGSLLLAAGVVGQVLGADRLQRLVAPLAAKPRWLAEIASIVLVAAVAAPAGRAFWSAAEPVRNHVEYAGLIPRLEALASQVGDDDLVLVESRDAGSDLHILAVPLAYIYAKQVLVLNSSAPDKRMLETFIAWADQRYNRVLFLGGGGTDLLARRLTAAPLGGDKFQVPEYDTPLNQYPSGIHRKEFEYGLYRLETREPAAIGAVDLRIGTLDDLNVVRFHAREVHGMTGVPYRWSQGQSLIILPGVPPTASQLTIWMGTGGRPATAPPAIVGVALDGRSLGSRTPVEDITPYTLELPPDLVQALAASGDPVRLQLRVPTWNPAALIGGADRRDLGIVVTRVEVR